ncbi:exosortase A [Alteromonas sp. 14N.309.X.WAT.G.H12]|uniref:exosortase A n=1 Tax=Alteromonas sp. 14N.309.X.WAT.G.H12 TaxID=3120824 RepID=UPI002FD00AD3
MLTPKIKYWVYLLLILVGTVIMISDAASNMIVLWLTTDTYMHGLFVLPLAAFMIANKPSPHTSRHPVGRHQALLLSFTWAALLLVGKLSLINVIQQVALISLIPLTVILCYGWRIAWHYRTPLMLVFFCVPVGDFLVPWLQSITADMAVFLLHATGVSVLRNGWYISIPAADFRVAEACSGVNFLISTFTLSIFYSFIYMTKWHKRAAFILLGFLVPLLSNGLRVYLIIIIAHYGNKEAATGFDHVVYGWIFFVFILIILFSIGHWWRDPIASPHQHDHPFKKIELAIAATPGKWALPLCLGLAIVANFAIAPLNETSARQQTPSNVSRAAKKEEIGEGLPLRPKFPMADAITLKEMGNWRQYKIVYYSENDDKKIISFQNRWFDDKIWSIKNKEKISILLHDGTVIPVDKWTLVGVTGSEYQLLTSYCVSKDWSSNTLMVKALKVKQQLLLNYTGSLAVAWFSPSTTPISQLTIQLESRTLCP